MGRVTRIRALCEGAHGGTRRMAVTPRLRPPPRRALLSAHRPAPSRSFRTLGRQTRHGSGCRCPGRAGRSPGAPRRSAPERCRKAHTSLALMPAHDQSLHHLSTAADLSQDDVLSCPIRGIRRPLSVKPSPPTTVADHGCRQPLPAAVADIATGAAWHVDDTHPVRQPKRPWR